MTILYVSPSIQRALQYTPEEIVGSSSLGYIMDMGDCEGTKRLLSTPSDGSNVLKLNIFIKSKHGKHVFICSTAFVCGNVCFHLATAYPHINFDDHTKPVGVRGFRCILGESNTQHGQHVLYNELNGYQSECNSGTDDIDDIVRREYYRSVVNWVRKAHQACIVLESLWSNNTDGNKGARIIYVTSTISRILSVDSCDLQNMPFLSLVAIEDITKAARFLDKTLHGNVLVVERLRLLQNPIEDSQLDGPDYVSVEFVAMGSDDGVIILCQLEQPKHSDGNGEYLSLDDIISSDVWTSEYVEE
ncbi:hypothetical protein GGI12_003036 [Dipsacomyces acuminosporus]|nr:hypothetical protein GGI12_003036 [Dipsacomyces acuminosporus]